MKFLLFFLGVVFFFIFYALSRVTGIEGTLLPDLFWIANIYVFSALTIIVFFIVPQSSFKIKNI